MINHKEVKNSLSKMLTVVLFRKDKMTHYSNERIVYSKEE